MKLYINGTQREVKAVYRHMDGKTVELRKGTLRYYAVVLAGILRGVVSLEEAVG